MNRATHLLPTLLLCAVAACGDADPSAGTHIGNPGELEVRAVSALRAPDGALTLQDDEGTEYRLTEARAHLRDIRLTPSAGLTCADLQPDLEGARCDSDGPEVIVDGPFEVDLLDGALPARLAQVRLPAVRWARVDLRLDDAPEGDLGLLAGHSLAARASFTHQGAPAELHIRLRFNEDARIEAPNGVQLPDGGTLRAELDASAWLRDLPLAECLEEGDLEVEGGVLRVDEESRCGEIEKVLKDNIKDHTRLTALE